MTPRIVAHQGLVEVADLCSQVCTDVYNMTCSLALLERVTEAGWWKPMDHEDGSREEGAPKCAVL
jgi:hypothetical protein